MSCKTHKVVPACSLECKLQSILIAKQVLHSIDRVRLGCSDIHLIGLGNAPHLLSDNRIKLIGRTARIVAVSCYARTMLVDAKVGAGIVGIGLCREERPILVRKERIGVLQKFACLISDIGTCGVEEGFRDTILENGKCRIDMSQSVECLCKVQVDGGSTV